MRSEREIGPAELLAEVRRLGLRTSADWAAIIRVDRDGHQGGRFRARRPAFRGAGSGGDCRRLEGARLAAPSLFSWTSSWPIVYLTKMRRQQTNVTSYALPSGSRIGSASKPSPWSTRRRWISLRRQVLPPMTPATSGSAARWAPSWSRSTGNWRRPTGHEGTRRAARCAERIGGAVPDAVVLVPRPHALSRHRRAGDDP